MSEFSFFPKSIPSESLSVTVRQGSIATAIQTFNGNPLSLTIASSVADHLELISRWPKQFLYAMASTDTLMLVGILGGFAGTPGADAVIATICEAITNVTLGAQLHDAVRYTQFVNTWGCLSGSGHAPGRVMAALDLYVDGQPLPVSPVPSGVARRALRFLRSYLGPMCFDSDFYGASNRALDELVVGAFSDVISVGATTEDHVMALVYGLGCFKSMSTIFTTGSGDPCVTPFVPTTDATVWRTVRGPALVEPAIAAFGAYATASMHLYAFTDAQRTSAFIDAVGGLDTLLQKTSWSTDVHPNASALGQAVFDGLLALDTTLLKWPDVGQRNRGRCLQHAAGVANKTIQMLVTNSVAGALQSQHVASLTTLLRALNDGLPGHETHADPPTIVQLCGALQGLASLGLQAIGSGTMTVQTVMWPEMTQGGPLGQIVDLSPVPVPLRPLIAPRGTSDQEFFTAITALGVALYGGFPDGPVDGAHHVYKTAYEFNFLHDVLGAIELAVNDLAQASAVLTEAWAYATAFVIVPRLRSLTGSAAVTACRLVRLWATPTSPFLCSESMQAKALQLFKDASVEQSLLSMIIARYASPYDTIAIQSAAFGALTQITSR